jgi:hypothetical protein
MFDLNSRVAAAWMVTVVDVCDEDSFVTEQIPGAI